MVLLFLDRLPLVSLSSYFTFSILLVMGATYHAWSNIDTDDASYSQMAFTIVDYLFEDPTCFWALANMGYCLLVLFGNYIQKLVFGKLRVLEADHFRQKFWNYVFYKFIFVFGVMSGDQMDTLILWSAWFSIIGFLLLHVQLGKERFDYLQMTLSSAQYQHKRLIFLLFGILCISSSLLGMSWYIGTQLGLSFFLLLAPECLLLILRSSHVLIRQSIRLKNGDRGSRLYNIDLLFDISVLVVDLLHHAHLMVASHLVLSMSSLVILLQIRLRANQLYLRLKRHNLVLKVRKSLKEHCQPVTPTDEMCSICWEDMASAVKLECSHNFHEECLQAWLEQDFSCPTCRQPPWKEVSKTDLVLRPGDGARSRSLANLGLFIYRLTSLRTRRGGETNETNGSPVDRVVSQVQEVFPSYPRRLIVDELLRTNSVDQAIANILDSQRIEELPLDPGPSTRDDLNLFESGAGSAAPEVMFSNRFSDNEIIKRRNIGESPLSPALATPTIVSDL